MKKRLSAEDEARIEERRAQILNAAASVFARAGYYRARTRDIAAEAGVAEGTLYNYYRSKREMLMAIAERIIGDANPNLLQRIGDEASTDWIKGVLTNRVDMLERNLPLLRAVVPELLADEELRDLYLGKVVFPYLASVMPHLLRRMPPGKRASARVVMPAVIGGLLAAYLGNAYAPEYFGQRVTAEELIDQLADFYNGGLRGAAAVDQAEVQS